MIARLFLAALAFGPAVVAPETRGAEVDRSLLQDFPFQGACISAPFPEGNTTMKGLAIRVGNGATMLFDTDLLRMSAGWTGGFLTTRGVAFDGSHGGHPSIDGRQVFGTPRLPGWSGQDGTFQDRRPEPFGPVNPDEARWEGLHLHDNGVVLAYTILGSRILERPSTVSEDGTIAFVRTFKCEPLKSAVDLLICEVPGATGELRDGQAFLTARDGTLTVVGAPRPSLNLAMPQVQGERVLLQRFTGAGLSRYSARLQVEGGRILLRLPVTPSEPSVTGMTYAVALASGTNASAAVLAATRAGTAIGNVREGGPVRWPEEVVTRGVLATSRTPDGAYVTDTLPPPLENPWKRRVRFSGLDFFKDGRRAALCTWDGDIWIVSGIEGDLQALHWKRFASGMYETLGLRIVDDVIHTSGRDQITRYHDFNGDGEADYYENFCNLYTSTEGFHEFVFDLQTGPDGSFYFAKAGPVRPGGSGFETISAHAGTLMKVSKDGRKLEVYATGFRAPNGLGVSPDGRITTGDNQGTWVPTCPLNWVEPGGFYGVEELAHRQPIPDFQQPLMWFAYREYDNSGGGQAWVTSDRWGPFQGELLHASYGKCAVYLISRQNTGQGPQGAAIRLPLRFASSAMRMRFNPADGQLYVAGMQGWQTDAARISGLDRVRYTGKPVYMLRAVAVSPDGVQLTFSQPLDQKEATDPQNYSGKRWNYRRTSNYGSEDYSATNLDRRGRDTLDIKSVVLSPDSRTVTLSIEDLRPVNVQILRFSLRARDGTPLEGEIQQTIHAIPGK